MKSIILLFIILFGPVLIINFLMKRFGLQRKTANRITLILFIIILTIYCCFADLPEYNPSALVPSITQNNMIS